MKSFYNLTREFPFSAQRPFPTHFYGNLLTTRWKGIDDGHQIADVAHFSGHSKAAPAGASRSPFDVGADRLRSLLDTLEIEL
jgi:hypothetical protein